MKSAIYDPLKRRCVVHQVLKDFLNMEHHMKALWILEDNYAEQRSLPILEYIDQIEKFVHLGDQKKALRERLTKELYFSEEVGADPMEEMIRFKRVAQMEFTKTDDAYDITDAAQTSDAPTSQAASQGQGPSNAGSSPDPGTPAPQVTQPATSPRRPPAPDTRPIELVIYSAMMRELNKLFTTHAKSNVQKFYSFIITMMSELELKPEVEANLTAWCHHNGKVEFNNIFSLEEMQQVIHTCYLWAVEFFGPDDADAMFSRALRTVENLPQANDFPPQNLL